jgi:hypothetical protein
VLHRPNLRESQRHDEDDAKPRTRQELDLGHAAQYSQSSEGRAGPRSPPAPPPRLLALAT